MSDDWDFYLAKVDHQPASIMVDLGIKPQTPMRTHPYMGYIRVYMRFAAENGLSTDKEFDALCKIGDAVDEMVAQSSHLYVGRNTSDGNRDFYFYSNDTASLEAELNNMMKTFPEYQFETGSREDPDWNVYAEFLYPSPDDKQRMMNRRVCEQLQKHGDELVSPRKIDHRCYFKKKMDAEAFKKELLTQNFAIVGTGRTKPLIGELFVDFDRSDTPSEIDDVVIPLVRLTEKHNGIYDGWGCEAQT